MRNLAVRGAAVAVLVLLSLFLPASTSTALGPRLESPAPVTLELFYGDGCPHCAAERELAQEYPGLAIVDHEVWYDAGNLALLEETGARMGFEPSGVPVTIIGERVWIGFSDAIAAEITAAVDEGTRRADVPDAEAADAEAANVAVTPEATSPSVDIPWVGSVDLSSSSLLVATVVIGFADGVNPCSLWVLSLLLAMVLSRGSRGRVILVGSTFLVVTTAMYGLYIVGFYTALDYMGSIAWIRLIVAAVAITFGLLQLKDGIRPGSGPSLSISQSARPRLYERMRGVAKPDGRLMATLAGTVVLAVGVSLLETPCTAGLPLLWTSMLTEQGVSTATAVALFGVYMLVFLLDELLIFGFAAVTLRGARLQQTQGRALKIVAGSVLLTLGLTMLVMPDAMDSLASTMLVFATAAVMAVGLWLVITTAEKSRRPS